MQLCISPEGNGEWAGNLRGRPIFFFTLVKTTDWKNR